MESSVQTEQELLEELRVLQARIIELEQAEAYHSQKEQERLRMDEFLSIASHELRTSLTTINGNIQLAKRRLQDLMFTKEPQEDITNTLDIAQELLIRAERQAWIQSRLVSDLLDVSRIQANRLDLHMVPCDLIAIVRETTEDQQAAQPARLITLIFPEQRTLPIIADAGRISQVIANYLTNALKYSPEKHPVDVHVEIKEQNAHVSVRDRGPGLLPVEQERVWQRFYRVPGTTVQTRTGAGLGLGLYICRNIIERHQGHVGVTSIPGQGSTFWFMLPCAQERLPGVKL